jgi:peptidoglycan/LPS O-acetylase OafA/YrhL
MQSRTASSRSERADFVPGVHVARACAILLVLAAHVIGLWTNQENFRYLPWQAYLKLVIDPLRIDHQAGGHMGLLLFFLVSGYIVSQAAEADSRASFALKRAARLIPAMVLAVGATILVASYDAGLGVQRPPDFNPDRAYSWHAIAEAVGLGTTFGGISVLFVLWTLYVEYQWYALLWAAGGIAARRPVMSTIGFMVAVLLLILFLSGPIGPLTITGSLGYVFVILIGRWIYIAHQRSVSIAWATVGIVGCLVLYAWTVWPEAGMEVLTGAHPRIAAVLWATVIFVGLLRFVRGMPWRPIRFVADVSYGIYLFHIPAMWLVLPVISPGGRLFTLGIAATVGLVMLAAWASYRFVETPIRRAVRRFIETREASGPATIAPEPAVPTAQ